MSTEWQPTEQDSPFARIGGVDAVRALAETFYEDMFQNEPALTAVHRRGEDGRVHPEMRERFALFLIGWLGGPQDYIQQHGHPRLRMRHGHVQVGTQMRDAWLRSMNRAMEKQNVSPEVRGYLATRFAGVADFLRNIEE